MRRVSIRPFNEGLLAILALKDGTIFRGISIGTAGHAAGEVVFNTALTGYQEILTDPSYSHQIVTLTYPHIGNTGVNPEDTEADKVHAAGLIIKDLPELASNFRSTQSLSAYLKAENVVAIADIDTRKLTRILREKGSQHGAILVDEDRPEKALEYARSFPGLVGVDLAKLVSTTKAYAWTEADWRLDKGDGKPGYAHQVAPRRHVVVYDFGVKRNMLRMLAERGCKLTVLPAQTPVAEA